MHPTDFSEHLLFAESYFRHWEIRELNKRLDSCSHGTCIPVGEETDDKEETGDNVRLCQSSERNGTGRWTLWHT